MTAWHHHNGNKNIVPNDNESFNYSVYKAVYVEPIMSIPFENSSELAKYTRLQLGCNLDLCRRQRQQQHFVVISEDSNNKLPTLFSMTT